MSLTWTQEFTPVDLEEVLGYLETLQCLWEMLDDSSGPLREAAIDKKPLDTNSAAVCSRRIDAVSHAALEIMYNLQEQIKLTVDAEYAEAKKRQEAAGWTS